MLVLSACPWLRNFDFSAVTKCEQRMAKNWRALNMPEKKKAKKKVDD
jgi:hypothetical protein